MIYNLVNKKAGSKIVIDGKVWKLGNYPNNKLILFFENSKDILYIADVYTGSIGWNKQVLEYILNRRLYKITKKYFTDSEIKRVATIKDVAKCIRVLARNIETINPKL